jgi:branched-chain amino acid aminotransferase
MSLAQKDGFIWMDGELVDWQEAKIHVLTHTFHYGTGVFEGVRAYETSQGPAIFRLNDHTDRLFRSAHLLKISMPYDRATLNEAHCAVIKANKLRSAYLRPVIYYGAESLGLRAKGLKTHAMVAAWEWASYMGEQAQSEGIRVCTSSFVRNHPNSLFTKAKANGNYMNSILAIQEAQANGFDEALVLDQNGFVAEGSAENFFMIHKGTIYTPDLTAALEGITRDTIMTLAADRGYKVVERRITRDEVYCADEAFFTGTAAEVVAIREVDGRAIGTGARGPITEQLQRDYHDTVHGRNAQHADWLSYIK